MLLTPFLQFIELLSPNAVGQAVPVKVGHPDVGIIDAFRDGITGVCDGCKIPAAVVDINGKLSEVLIDLADAKTGDYVYCAAGMAYESRFSGQGICGKKI